MALWNLRGDDALDAVKLYNPNAAVFSDDGTRIRAPWGLRLVGREWTSSPLWRALRQLESDPYSLRCSVPVYVEQDIAVASRDVPCLLALNLSIRDGGLLVTAMLRALNAYSVFPHDHCLLACLCEALRAHLALPRVTLSYYVDSLHISAGEADRARAAVAAMPHDSSRPPLRFRDCDIRGAIDEVRRYEPRLRAALMRGDSAAVDAHALDIKSSGSTWAADVLGLLHAEWQQGESVTQMASR